MIYLSPSSLDAWYRNGCPARWQYEKAWEPKEKNEFAERGTLVHAMLSGDIDPDSVTDKTALMFFQKIKDADAFSGLTTLATELRQEFSLAEQGYPDIVWVRRIDRIALTQEGRPVIVDYKTTGALWKTLEGSDIVPQTLGFQTPGYLLDAPQDQWPEGLRSRPLSVYYLVAGFRGAASFYRVDDSAELSANFFRAIGLIECAIKENHFPKIHGKACLECPMNAVCYSLPGWRKKYTKRKRH